MDLDKQVAHLSGWIAAQNDILSALVDAAPDKHLLLAALQKRRERGIAIVLGTTAMDEMQAAYEDAMNRYIANLANDLVPKR